MSKVIRSGLIILLAGVVCFCCPATAGAITKGYLRENGFIGNRIYNREDNGCVEGGSKNCIPLDGDQITFIADSLVAKGGKDLFESVFPGADYGGTWNNTSSFVQSGKAINQDNGNAGGPGGLDILRRLVNGEIAGHELRPYLVFALGANSPWTGGNYVDKLLELVGEDTQILLVTTKIIPPHWAANATSKTYPNSNAVLEEAAKEHKNITVADWASTVKDEYFIDGDGVHYGDGDTEGNRAYLRFIRDSLPQNCTDSTGMVSEQVWSWLYNYFDKQKIEGVTTSNVVAGIMGNLLVESGVNPFLLGHDYQTNSNHGWGIHMNLGNCGGWELRDKVNEAVGSSDYWYFDDWWTDEKDADKDFEEKGIPASVVTKAIDVELSLITDTSWAYSNWSEFMDGLRNWGVKDDPRAYSDLFLVTIERAVGGNSPIEDPGVLNHYSGLYQGSEERRNNAEYFLENYSGRVVSAAKITQCDCAAGGSYTSSGDASEVTGDDNYERVRTATRAFGSVAIEAQIKWGSPWEVVIAQMGVESAYGRAIPAQNNWLGITGSGDAGYEIANNRKFAAYSSVAVSIDDWAGKRVLRNGLYDDAFQYLQLDNYDLDNFIKTMLNTYAPPSDGNDVSAYYASVKVLIEKIREEAQELGLPTSEEIAKKYMIDPSAEPPYNSTSVGRDVVNCDDNASTNGELVLYNQSDEPWGSKRYGNESYCSTISEGGCGPASLAMIITALTGKRVTPDEVAQKAADKGHRACNNGSYPSISEVARDYGLTVIHHPASDWKITTISAILQNGGMVQVAGGGANPFTSGGHFIGIRGISANGKWYIFDSAGSHFINYPDNNTKEWEPSTIINAGSINPVGFYEIRK